MSTDHNVNAAAHYFEAEQSANEHACYRAAHANGLTPEQADECDDGDKGCPSCPFKRTTAAPAKVALLSRRASMNEQKGGSPPPPANEVSSSGEPGMDEQEASDTDRLNWLEQWHQMPGQPDGYGDTGLAFFFRGSDGFQVDDEVGGGCHDTLREAVDAAIASLRASEQDAGRSA